MHQILLVNKAEAQKLLEFLTSEKAQKLYGEINFEYPANLKIEPGDELKSWGNFRERGASPGYSFWLGLC